MMRRFLPVMTIASLSRREQLPAPWPGLSDPDDAPVWATARLAGAQYVVSHNTRHFPPLDQGKHLYEGVEYLTAIEFVEDVLGADAEAAYGPLLPSGDLVRSRRHP